MNAAIRLSTLIMFTSMLAPGCRRDAKTELMTWKRQTCSCEEQACATKQRREFWRLVQEFRDDAPSQQQARQLGELIDEGQACLEQMSVDIYATN